MPSRTAAGNRLSRSGVVALLCLMLGALPGFALAAGQVGWDGPTLVMEARHAKGLTNIGACVFFAVRDQERGAGLWHCGRDMPEPVFVDLCAEDADGKVSAILDFDGRVMVFGACRHTRGYKGMWLSDRTGGALELVRVLDRGLVGRLVRTERAGAALYLQFAHALWRTDGTDAGTVQGFEIVSVPIDWMTELDGALLMFRNHRLWRSDGTRDGTVLVTGREYNRLEHAYASEGLVLAVEEPYILRHPRGRPERIADIRERGEPSYPRNLVRAGRHVVFTANDGVNGRQLWATDGTTAGTVMVWRRKRGIGSIELGGACSAEGCAYVVIKGDGLYVTDGTAAGTHLAMSVRDWSTRAALVGFRAVGPDIVFRRANRFWVSAGTPESSGQLAEDWFDVSEAAVLKDCLFFLGTRRGRLRRENRTGLWRIRRMR